LLAPLETGLKKNTNNLYCQQLLNKTGAEKMTPEIVLTGGPCAGKTTALNYLQEKLSDYGSRVLVIPEIPTIVIAGGVHDINELPEDKRNGVQVNMITMYYAVRKHFQRLASVLGGNSVIIHDRGIMDFKAYMDPELFKEVLRLMLGMHELEARDSYDGIMHLVTAACGAEAFYTIANNKARRERNLDEAKILDEKTLKQWIGHPHLKVIDNSTDFEGKLRRIRQAMCRVLGIPAPLEIERKFVLYEMPRLDSIVQYQSIQIEQMYLAAPENEEARIRKRTQNGSSMHYYTRKIKVRPGVRNETEEKISAEEFNRLSAMRLPYSSRIKKNRFCFVWKNQYFELDVFTEPEWTEGLFILEIELTEENDEVIIPPFLKVNREVTNEQAYSNFSLATESTT